MKHTAIATMLLSCVLLSACAMPSVARRDPGTLVVLEASDANTMNPLFANNEPSFLYYGLVLDSLANVGPNFTMIPWLATSWSSTPDRLHWTVQLRHGVRWSDGAPFTSKDVVWTWHAMLDPKTGYPYAGQFNYIKNVRALGPYAVRF
ncbi:MAG: ABC transporter substrate-binding protein, partial [Vulcanimicrobiaceae bacterium]